MQKLISKACLNIPHSLAIPYSMQDAVVVIHLGIVLPKCTFHHILLISVRLCYKLDQKTLLTKSSLQIVILQAE